MSINEEELQESLSNMLGGNQGSTQEGLDYARNILAQYTGMPNPMEEALESKREQEQSVVGALEQARKRINELKGVSRSEKLLAIGRGLGQSTKTGSIGETASNVAAQMQPLAAQQREFEQGQASTLNALDLAQAQAHAPVSDAEFELATLDREIQGRLAQESLKTIARGATTGRQSASSKARREKIDDMMRLWNLPEAVAMAHVDGEIKMTQSATGGTILTNDITGEAFEVDGASPEDLARYLPDDSLRGQGTGRPFNPSRSTVDPDAKVDPRLEIERMADDIVGKRIDNGDSIWEMAKVATGPYANVRLGMSFVSSLFGGPVATRTIEARHGLNVRGRDLAKALIPNDRMPVALVQMAIDDAAIAPSALDTPEMMQSRLVSLDREMFDMYLDAVEDTTNSKLLPAMHKDQEQNARELAIFLRDLRVPPEFQDRRQRVLSNGTIFPQGKDRPLREDERLLLKPPSNFPGTQREWDLMPLSHRELYKDDYR